jgi:hypothetical protein
MYVFSYGVTPYLKTEQNNSPEAATPARQRVTDSSMIVHKYSDSSHNFVIRP